MVFALPLQFDQTFEEEKRAIVDYMVDYSTLLTPPALDFSKYQSIVLTLSSERTVTAESPSLRQLFMDGRSGIGWKSDLVLPSAFQRESQKTDALILDGIAALEFEHVGSLKDGRPCTFFTYKRRLDELKSPNYQILMVSRPIAFVGSSEIERKRSLTELVALLQSLDSVDLTICRSYAKGDTTKDVASKVGLTGRSVEIRRQKILEVFGFERPIEIVKMLVRLEEHGLI